MKYLPALILGILLFFIVNFAFTISAEYSPILEYLKSTPNLNSNSSEYWLLGIHDAIIVILISLLLLLAYRFILPKFPFDLLAAFLIQIPIVIFSFIIQSVNFNSSYQAATSTVSLISFISIGLAFFVIIAYNKKINKDT